MASFAGIRGTGSYGDDERPKSFREMILWRQPNGSCPFTALIDKMGKQSTTDPEFSWWDEVQYVARLQTINSSQAAGVTSLQFEATAGAGRQGSVFDCRPGDLLLVEHEPVDGQLYTPALWEIVQVIVAPTTAGVLQVARGYGGSTAGTIAAGSFLSHLGSAHAEGSRSPTSASRNPTKYRNFCQIFKTPFEVTRTAVTTKIRTGNPLDNEKLRAMFRHQTAIEQQFWFGHASELMGSTGTPERQTGGILSFLTDNVKVWATPPSEDELIDVFTPLFNTSAPELGDERLAYCGNMFLNALNKVIAASPSTRINYQGVLSLYGVKFQKYQFPMGEVAFKMHPLWNNHARFRNSCAVIAPAAIKYRPLMDTKEQKNIQEADADLVKNQWITEAGLEIHHQSAHGFFHITDTALPA